ncbi:cytochrome c oxidase copper chaperone [Apis mellifera caucasica]|uniref:Cytochrome c oxidase copper chaperone n=1 Tax=Apis mellifera TaxID=7460 RepID=A0A7M7G389_APIME|nr:cytochrome c oxidase copper chaperone [Apis mellifera]KAG6794419.1 cytochrome c oxidase copper chaperone [Apis mellifera caucasica]KAG9429279.1 cytochrome c oxidase copper chaperone [Apis mellifera carnica]|eukprot:XP_001122739.1 cytochrome c oxidase copper chaperone [Apis mellifera]
MGIINDKPNVSAESKDVQKSDKPLKPCCACPETKKARDDCIITKGEENCRDLIEAHKTCMRSLGFNI